MRVTFLTFFLSLLLISSCGQIRPKGKWYTFSYGSDDLIEYRFDSLTFISNQSNSVSDTLKIVKIINQNKNVYYLFKSDKFNKYMTMAISELKLDTSFTQLPTPADITYFSNLDSTLAFIKGDTLRRSGLTFFSEKEVGYLKSLPRATEISKPALKNYLLSFIKAKDDYNTFRLNNSKYFDLGFFITYVYNQSKALFASVGYNPFVPDNDMNVIMEKYSDDDEIKSLVESSENLFDVSEFVSQTEPLNIKINKNGFFVNETEVSGIWQVNLFETHFGKADRDVAGTLIYDDDGITLFKEFKDGKYVDEVSEIHLFLGKVLSEQNVPQNFFRATLFIDELMVTEGLDPEAVRSSLKKWKMEEFASMHSYRYNNGKVYVFFKFNEEKNLLIQVSIGRI